MSLVAMAVLNGHTDIAKLLIRDGADPYMYVTSPYSQNMHYTDGKQYDYVILITDDNYYCSPPVFSWLRTHDIKRVYLSFRCIENYKQLM